jgi:hypothetical protein
MKTRNAPFLQFLLLAYFSIVLMQGLQAQPDYIFKNNALVSGTLNQVGSVYRFSNIKPGIDGLVTITSTINLTLNNLDGTGAGGFDEALQPEVIIPPYTSGYVEFRVDFVVNGSTTPHVITEIPFTAIDIDGGVMGPDTLFESDSYEKTVSCYINFSTASTDLKVTQAGGFYNIQNVSGILFNGVDTVQRNVMFSIVYANISSLTFRVGGTNKTPYNWLRLRSVYFKKFSYPSGVLPENTISDFSGTHDNGFIHLRYTLSSPDQVEAVVIEKAESSMIFSPFTTQRPELENYNYQIKDFQKEATSYYRLKLIMKNGQYFYSTVLKFESRPAESQIFKVYPTAVHSDLKLQIQSSANTTAFITIYDYNGRIVHAEKTTLHTGTQLISIGGLSLLSSGNYVVVARYEDHEYQQRIQKQ